MPTVRPAATFNDYILKSVAMIAQSRAGKGYDLHSYFTQNLTYGPDNPGAINANHPPQTMCVAAVTEVMIEALNIYYSETHDKSPFQALPVGSWQHGSMSDIRAHIFQYDGAHCNGTAHALQRFGIGQQLPFDALLPGDFVTLNRTTGHGHTCVFLGFIGADFADLAQYSAAVKGFRYFSAQGSLATGGFGYRWAFFSPFCPDQVPGKQRDCNIIYTPNQHLLNVGCMLHPSVWHVHPPDDLQPQVLWEDHVQLELAPSDLSKYDGVTTDD